MATKGAKTAEVGKKKKSISNESTNQSKIIPRHYSTIGIGDVFLSPPKHPLLRVYLDDHERQQEELDSNYPNGFMSWEILGTVKKEPEDFVVRECLPRHKTILGLTDTYLRVADLLESGPGLAQTLDAANADTSSSKAKKEANTDGASTNLEAERPIQVIQRYLRRIYASREGKDDIASCISNTLRSLQALQNSAIARLQNLSMKETREDGSQESGPLGTVWIPPASSSGDHVPLERWERGALHRALNVEYSMVKSDSVPRTGEGSCPQDHWIRVTTDDTFESLVPFLQKPALDLPSLHLFRNRGVEGAIEHRHEPRLGPSRSRGNHNGRVNGGSKVFLRLQPGIPKESRRSVHHLIAQKCRHFETSTISDFVSDMEEVEEKPAQDAGRESNGKLEQSSNQSVDTATTAVVVQWSQTALRAAKKRKRGPERAKESEPYPHVLCVLKKRKTEHLTAMHNLTEAIHCRQSDIGFAGIKDMQAVTYQYCTFRNTRPARVENVNNFLKKKGMELGSVVKVDWLLNNGDLEGNHFDIVVRNLRRVHVQFLSSEPKEMLVPCEQIHILQMVERVRASGFVNFYGEQRIGAPGSSDDVGVRAFDIGKAMLQQRFSLAVDLLLTGRSAGHFEGIQEDEKARKVHATWTETSGDVIATLKALPGGNVMPRERAVLKGLKRYGKDKPLEALRMLQFHMRIFFVNAYQSYIWNLAATERIKIYGTKAVKGDLYIEEGGDPREVKVAGPETSISLSQVLLPLPGYNIRYPEHEIGSVYERLLEKDGIVFDKHSPPEATAKGSYRKLIELPIGLTATFDQPSDDHGYTETMKLSFQLSKGCYATMLLRELMLTTARRPVV